MALEKEAAGLQSSKVSSADARSNCSAQCVGCDLLFELHTPYRGMASVLCHMHLWHVAQEGKQVFQQTWHANPGKHGHDRAAARP